MRFPGFEKEWETIKLGDITVWSSGGTPSKKNPLFWNGEIPWISASSMRGFAYSDSELKITGAGLQKGSRLAKKGSLLILVRGSMLFNKIPIGIVLRDVAFNQDVKSIVVSDHSSSEYILNWFAAFEPKILNMVTGTGIGAGKLDLADLKSLEVKIPHISEQKKISHFLSLINERITSSKKIIEDLTKMKSSVAHKIFSQKVKFNNSNRWVVKKLEDLVEFYKGSSLSKGDISSEGKIKCIHYGELFTIYNEVVFSVISRTEKTGFYSKAGDILMPSSDVTPLGLATASAILEDGVLLGGDINVLRPLGEINSVFLSYLLNYEKKKIIELVSGTTIKHIYFKDLKGINLIIPFLIEEQNKIAQVLSSIDGKINLERDLLIQYEIQKKYLLANLFI